MNSTFVSSFVVGSSSLSASFLPMLLKNLFKHLALPRSSVIILPSPSLSVLIDIFELLPCISQTIFQNSYEFFACTN